LKKIKSFALFPENRSAVKEATMKLKIAAVCLLLFFLTNRLFAADTAYAPVRNCVPFTVPNNGIAYALDLSSRIDAGSDSMLRVYDIPSNTLRKTIRIPSYWRLETYTYSADPAGFVVIFCDSGYYKVTISSGICKKMYPIPMSLYFTEKCISNDYSKIIYITKDSSLYIADTSLSPPKRLFTNTKTASSFVAFYPDNKRVLTLNEKDSTLRIWNTDEDAILAEKHIPFKTLESAGFSRSDDKILIPISSSTTRSYMIVDAMTGNILSSDSASYNSTQKTWYYPVSIQFSSDDSKVLFGEPWTSTFIVDMATKKCRAYNIGSSGAYFWYYNPPWFTAGDTAAIIHAYNTGTLVNELYELSATTGKLSQRYTKQYRPVVRYSGFSNKGEPLLIGRYYYTAYSSFSGFSDVDTTLYWNAETDKEFLKRIGITQPQGTADYIFEDYFSADGTRLFQESWNVDIGSNNYLRGISIFNIADTGQLVAAINGSKILTSQDRSSACVFEDSIVKIVDAQSSNISQIPFKLPSQWIPYAIMPSLNIMCACSTSTPSQFSGTFYTLSAWDLRTNALIGKFYIGGMDWFDNKYHTMTPRVFITTDGAGVIITSSNGTKMLDIHTGSLLKAFTYDNTNVANVTLTPDGNQLIIGNCCYLTSTGELLRVYNGMSGFNYVAFNPRDNRQFIAGGKIWELPFPVGTIHRPPIQPKPSSVQCYADFRSLNINIQFARGEKAIVALYQLNGRCVLKKNLALLSGQCKVAFPKPAQGTYVYRLEVPSIAVSNQGKFMIR
jgi:hypothetical protein